MSNSSSLQCYWSGPSGPVDTPYDQPCDQLSNGAGPTSVSCCQNGDVCMSNGICQSRRSLLPGSGFYPSRCTRDPRSNAAGGGGCDMLCANQDFPSLLWDPASSSWHCCSHDTDEPTCLQASSTITAPSPNELVATHIAGYTFDTHSLPHAASLNAGPAAPHGLSIAAMAGIGVSVGVIGLALVGGLGWWVWRRREQKRYLKEKNQVADESSTGPPQVQLNL